jgi:hypothetical protein
MVDELGLRLKEALELRGPIIHHLTSDKKLAKLGDALINYIASISETVRNRAPTGIRVDNRTLTMAVRESGLRDVLAHRMDRHMLGNAAEALMAFAWINGGTTVEEYVEVMLRAGTLQDGITGALRLAVERTGVMMTDAH